MLQTGKRQAMLDLERIDVVILLSGVCIAACIQTTSTLVVVEPTLICSFLTVYGADRDILVCAVMVTKGGWYYKRREQEPVWKHDGYLEPQPCRHKCTLVFSDAKITAYQTHPLK
uniref:Uncharacterized protein n=1 Tax=Aegilops tauschii subsp. strangulata TaxID=200361 RepID=A0A453ITK5_AEGTS